MKARAFMVVFGRLAKVVVGAKPTHDVWVQSTDFLQELERVVPATELVKGGVR